MLEFPVVIIGGCPVDLTCSALLSLLGIDNVVYERYPDTSIHPKALGLNQRTMEVFQLIGVEDLVSESAAPDESVSRTAWYSNLGPDHVEIYNREALGGRGLWPSYLQASPTRYTILPQTRLEPILKQRAQQLCPGVIKYNTEVTEICESGHSVIVHLRSTDSRELSKVSAGYVIVADGGRGMAEKLGIVWTGTSDLVDMFNPKLRESRGSDYVYHIGPWLAKAASEEEWVFAAPKHEVDPSHFDHSAMAERIQKTLELPDLPIDIISISHWSVNAKVVDSYTTKSGRVHLVGDAAHRVPPWAALGMNSGIQDASNLIWKLSHAIRHGHNDALLRSYDEERRPIAQRVADHCLRNMHLHADRMDAAVGIDGNLSVWENLIAINRFSDPRDASFADRRRAVEEASVALDSEFNAPGLEIGWYYPSVSRRFQDYVPGQPCTNKFDWAKYTPCTIPGHHLLHAWLACNGSSISTRDMLTGDNFVLILNPSCSITKANLSGVTVVKIGEEWLDISNTWTAVCGVGNNGAVLTRPDGIVIWRTDL